MKGTLVAALVLAAVAGAAGCAGPRGSAGSPEAGTLGMTIKDYQVVWARGGKLGYVKTYDVAGRNDSPVRIHYVSGLDLEDRGWVADDGQGERFVPLDPKTREAYREPFERQTLPVDSVVNQIKRILMVDPSTEIVLRTADYVDVQR